MKLQNYLPILEWLPKYDRSTLRADLIAGITVAVMLVPQGMAYSILTGMPPIYGLYTGLVPLILYAILGTSRQMSIGPVAVSSLLVFAGVRELAEEGSPEFIKLVILAGLLIGLVQLIMGVLRMGFLVNFLSHPVIIGFTSAAAIIIAISQLKGLLGFSIPRFNQSFDTLKYAIAHIGETQWQTVVMCVGSIIVMLILKKIKKSIPGALIVVGIGTALTYLLRLDQQGLAIVKEVPKGIPLFIMPDITLENIRILLPVVATVTVIEIIESISIAKVLEAKHQNYVVRPNQELLALGISKIGGAFYQAIPSSGSFTRSAINNDSGAKTGMASIFTALLIAMTLLFLTPLFYYLPKAVLAAIILLAVKSLFDMKEAMHLWHTHRMDFVMMLITFIVTLLSSIQTGVMAGVVVSILAVLYRSSKPDIIVLGSIPNTTSYRSVERFKKATQTEETLVIRFDNQLYFANASPFKDTVKDLTRARRGKLKALILDASSIHDIDSSGLHALEEIHRYLQNNGITFYLTGVIGKVRDILKKSGVMDKIGTENFYLKNHDAVLSHHSTISEYNEGWTEEAIQTNLDSKKDGS